MAIGNACAVMILTVAYLRIDWEREACNATDRVNNQDSDLNDSLLPRFEEENLVKEMLK